MVIWLDAMIGDVTNEDRFVKRNVRVVCGMCAAGNPDALMVEAVTVAGHLAGRRHTVGRAFTLLEMLAVLALAAVLTSAVAVSLRGVARGARVEDVAGQFAGFDRTARDAARRFGRPLELRFDLGRGTVRRAGGGQAAMPLRLPEGFRVAGLVLPGGAVAAGGEVRVPVSVRGQTPSYAVRLAGGNGEELWVVAAGLTGRTLVVRDADDVQDIFAAEVPASASAGGRADAD